MREGILDPQAADIDPALNVSQSHWVETTRPAISHRTTVYPTTTWDCAISSIYHGSGSTVEREAKSGTRPTPSQQRRSTWRLYLTRNRTSESNPRSYRHLFLRPQKTGNPAVRVQVYLGDLSDHSDRFSGQIRQRRSRSRTISNRNRTGQTIKNPRTHCPAKCDG